VTVPILASLLGVSVVLCRAESHEPLLVDVDPERLKACNRHIDSHVEFQAIDQEGVVDVVRHNCVGLLLDLSGRVRNDPDPDSLASRRGLVNVQLPALLPALPVRHEIGSVGGKNPRFGEIGERLGPKDPPEARAGAGHVVLAPEEKCACGIRVDHAEFSV